MATSGTINGTCYQYDGTTVSSSYYSFYASWSATTNTSARTSSVTVTLYLKGLSSAESYSAYWNGYITYGGTEYHVKSNATASVTNGVTLNLGSKTFTVSHNDSGAASFSISARYDNLIGSGYNNKYVTKSGRLGGTGTLNNIGSASVAVTGVSLNVTSKNTSVGKTFSITPTVKPNNATNKSVTWSTSNGGVATVSNGTVTATGPGSCTITANASGKTATCSVTVVNDTGPSGSISSTYDPTWTDEQGLRVNHQTMYSLKVNGRFMDSVVVGGSNMNRVVVGSTKVWFRPKNLTSVISCQNFVRSGNIGNNSSGGCASVDHCSNLFSSNRTNPIRPRQLTMSYTFNTFHNHSGQVAYVKLFGLNSNGNWVDLSLSYNGITAEDAANSGSLTITCNTKNFFTNFKIGIFPVNKTYFVTTCNLTSIKITSYDVDASLE